MSELTQILDGIQHDDPKAAEELLQLVYSELRKVAAQKMAMEAPGHTLQATALVHEAWLRLRGEHMPSWQNRSHFLAAAAEAMRRILIENARRKLAQKRGARPGRINLEDLDLAVEANDDTLLMVNEALEKLKVEDHRAAELVNLRFFGGLNLVEAGEVLGISERTAKRCWAFARAWLFNELSAARKN